MSYAGLESSDEDDNRQQPEDGQDDATEAVPTQGTGRLKKRQHDETEEGIAQDDAQGMEQELEDLDDAAVDATNGQADVNESQRKRARAIFDESDDDE